MEIKGKTIHMGELEFTNFIKALIRSYQYHNQNQNPKSVVLPAVYEVDGVQVIFPVNVKESK